MTAAAAACEALLEMEGQQEQPRGEAGTLAHLITHSASKCQFMFQTLQQLVRMILYLGCKGQRAVGGSPLLLTRDLPTLLVGSLVGQSQPFCKIFHFDFCAAAAARNFLINLPSVRLIKSWGFYKQACCRGCRRRPFLMQLHQEAKSAHLNQYCNIDLLDLECPKSVQLV